MKPFFEYRKKLSEQLDTVGTVEIQFNDTNNPMTTTRNPDDIIRNLAQFFIQIRAFHWQTESFAQHKASDDTYESINDILDKLVESYQGYYGRVKIGGQLNIFNLENLNLEQWLGSIVQEIEELRCLVKEQSDLCNIIDEFLGAISKFRYLLSLK